jgi:type I restriction enzyme R subunit
MGGMDKRRFTERDICTKCIAPALRNAGWDEISQIKEEKSFTKGRFTVRLMKRMTRPMHT